MAEARPSACLSRFIAVAALAAGTGACARPPQVSSDALPLRRVVVYRNGVAYFERSGTVENDEVRFKMRKEMVGDFLATLAIVERGGSSVRSASFPLEVQEDDSDEETPPEYRSMLKPWPPPKEKKKGFDLREVILGLDGKRHDLAVGYIAETPVWRPSYRLVVGKKGQASLQAWGIVQNLSGEDWTQVSLALVAGAPLAFESTLGTPVVPARPVVTDRGEVIAAVPKGVTSLKQRREQEVERYGGEDGDDAEPEAEEAAAAGEMAPPAPPRSSRGVGLSGSGKGGGGYGRGLGGFAKAKKSRRRAAYDKRDLKDREKSRLYGPRSESVSAPRDLSSLAAVAVQGGTTRYDIPTPVTVPNESATMVLLLNQSVPGEAVFLFAPDGGVPDSSRHPFRVARFKNATKGLLEKGPIAVFEEGNFLGQGIVSSLPPAATATVPFALERSLAVDVDHRTKNLNARLARIEGGRLWVSRDEVRHTIYTVRNGDDERAKLLVKHRRRSGYRLYKAPKGTEDNTGEGNALIPLSVAPNGKSELTVDERRDYDRSVGWLSSYAAMAVEAYIKDPRANQAVVAQLGKAWALRSALKSLRDERNKLRNEQRELDASARQTRLSLKAIEKNRQAADLRLRLTRRLKEISSRQEVVSKRLIELKMEMDEKQVRFDESVRLIKLPKGLPVKE